MSTLLDRIGKGKPASAPAGAAVVESLYQDERWQVANNKLGALKAAKLQREQELLQREQAYIKGTGNTVTQFQRDALNLLEGKTETPGPELESLDKLRRDILLHTEAIKLAERAFADECARVSKSICAAKLPGYKALVERTCKILKELQAVGREEDTIRSSLEAAGISWSHSLFPMPITDRIQWFADNYAKEAKAFYGVCA